MGKIDLATQCLATLVMLLGLLLSSFWCIAKDPIQDSLLVVLSVEKEDTVKVNALNALSALINRSEPTEAISYGNQARVLAEKLNDQKGLAYALKNIGLGYFMQSNFFEASISWEHSLKIFESLHDEDGIANVISNLGTAYSYMGDDVKAVDYYLKSLKIAEKKGDSLQIATCLLNIGSTYAWKPETLDEALPYYKRAYGISESINYLDGITLIASNLGDYYFQKEIYDSALLYFERSLKYTENAIDIAPTYNNIGKIYTKKGDFKSAIKYQKDALEIAEKIDGKLEMAQIHLGLANTYNKQGNLKLAIEHFERAKAIAKEIESNYELKDAFEGLTYIYAGLLDFQNAFKFQSLLRETEKSIYNSETDDKIKNLQFSFQLDKKEDQIEILEQQSEIEGLKIARQETVIYAGTITMFLLILMAIGLYNRFRYVRRTKKVIEMEKDKSEQLLLNILPAETARELENNGHATPRFYDSVSVLFTDFKSFTKLAESLSSKDLVEELNTCFSAFDDIIENHGLEKIKTIGDAYMCAGGIPTTNQTHPINAVRAGQAMQEYMNFKNEQRKKQGMVTWELRVGIHTGSIVAGVVGKKKYAYDIWGDTVNIASRMESNGEVGKVNISAATYELIRDNFECQYRGKIAAKNKGNIDMYFIEKEKETTEALK